MIDLLKRELPSHFKLHRTIVDVPYEITAEEHFDFDRQRSYIYRDYGLSSEYFFDQRLGRFNQKFRLLIMKRI